MKVKTKHKLYAEILLSGAGLDNFSDILVQPAFIEAVRSDPAQKLELHGDQGTIRLKADKFQELVGQGVLPPAFGEAFGRAARHVESTVGNRSLIKHLLINDIMIESDTRNVEGREGVRVTFERCPW